MVKWGPMLEPFEEFGKDFVGSFSLAVDVYEDKDNIIVEAPMPKADPEQININIENNVLSISASNQKKTEVDDKNYYRKEIKAGSYSRSISLPKAVVGDKAKAEYEDGILKITVPKSETAKPKKIKVNIKKNKLKNNNI